MSMKFTFRQYGLSLQRMEFTKRGIKIRLFSEPKNYAALRWVGDALGWKYIGCSVDKQGFYAVYKLSRTAAAAAD